jgi:hypothetical protein
VDGGNVQPVVGTSVLESVTGDTGRGVVGDKLDGLDDTVDDLVLDTGVLSLGVLTDDDRVDVVVGGAVTLNGTAGTDVGVEVEGATEGEVERDVTLTDCKERVSKY